MDTAEGKIAALEGASATHATKDELNAVDKKFEDYTKTSDLPTDLGDFTNNAGYAKTADVNAELDKKADKTQVATDIANAIAPLATTEALNGVKATAEAAVTDAKLATALEPYAKTANVSATYETKDDASSKLAEAKKYTDDAIAAIPAQTDYSVTITENTDDNTVAKTYVFSQCGAEIGSIKLAKELVVTSGSVKEVVTADAPYAGAVVGDKYIELVIANQEAPIYVPAKDLVDIYTAKDMTGVEGAEVQVAISNTNEISATLVNGGITEEKLAEGVKTKLNKVWEEVGVAAGLVATEKGDREAADAELATAIDNAKTEAANQDAVVLAEAQKSANQAKADAIADAAGKYETIGTAQGIVDGLKLSETYEPIGAESRAIADAEGKINALAGEGNTSTVKKNADDIASLFEQFQWGSF